MYHYPWRPINLRAELKAEIPSTTYLSHGLHNYYPAKFIPQVPRFVIRELGLTGKIILDPFAGSGTTAVESLVTGNANISNDINPLTSFLIELKTLRLEPRAAWSHRETLSKLLQQAFKSKKEFRPDWGNLEYWYPPEILPIISSLWGGIYALDDEHPALLKIIKAAALHVARKFSYDEDDSPKLFKSKFKRRKMKEILAALQERGAELITDALQARAERYLEGVLSFSEAIQADFEIVDEWRVLERPFVVRLCESVEKLAAAIPADSVDCVVTSPPYMYAQEYMRSTKLDMYWLGLANDASVRELTRSEIGQRTKAGVSPNGELATVASYTETLAHVQALANNFKTPSNVARFEAYFGDMLAFINVSRQVLRPGGHLTIFVGDPKVFGQHVPSKDIFAELMTTHGFEIEQIYFDTIKSRQLALERQNANPEGMPGEWLIFGRKK